MGFAIAMTAIISFTAGYAASCLTAVMAGRSARRKRLPPPWQCPACGLPHRIATCTSDQWNPPSALVERS